MINTHTHIHIYIIVYIIILHCINIIIKYYKTICNLHQFALYKIPKQINSSEFISALHQLLDAIEISSIGHQERWPPAGNSQMWTALNDLNVWLDMAWPLKKRHVWGPLTEVLQWNLRLLLTKRQPKVRLYPEMQQNSWVSDWNTSRHSFQRVLTAPKLQHSNIQQLILILPHRSNS